MKSTAVHFPKVVFSSTDSCLTCSHPNYNSKSVSFCNESNVNEKCPFINLFERMTESAHNEEQLSNCKILKNDCTAWN
jgi:hypothetical protein